MLSFKIALAIGCAHMAFDYALSDRRLVNDAAAGVLWGTVMATQAIRKKFNALFALSSAGCALLTYDAAAQLSAHRAYARAKYSHNTFQNERIALIAQSQKLVPVSAKENVLIIERIRTLLQNGFVPYIATIHDVPQIESAIHHLEDSGNKIRLIYLRSDFNSKVLLLGSFYSFPRLIKILNNNLRSDTPIIIERNFESFLYTRLDKRQPAVTLSGRDALDAALNDFNLSGLSYKAEKSNISL